MQSEPRGTKCDDMITARATMACRESPFFGNPIFNLPYPSNRILRWCRWFVVSTNACLLILLTNLYALRSSVHLWAVLWHFINAFRPQRTQSPSAPAGWISPYFSTYSHAGIVIFFRHSSQFIIQKSRIKGCNNSSDRLAPIITRKDSAHDGGCHISSFRRLGSPAQICLGRLAVSSPSDLSLPKLKFTVRLTLMLSKLAWSLHSISELCPDSNGPVQPGAYIFRDNKDLTWSGLGYFGVDCKFQAWRLQ